MGDKDLGTPDQKLNRWDSFPKFLDFLVNCCKYFLFVGTVNESFYLRNNQPQYCLFGDLGGAVGVQLSFKILRGSKFKDFYRPCALKTAYKTLVEGEFK